MNEVSKAIDLILKDLRKNAISKEHRHAVINPDCPSCKFRILEGFLEWYQNLIIWNEKFDKQNLTK